MLESTYTALIAISSLFLVIPSFAQKVMHQMVAYGLATILFGVLAASSTAVEFMACTSTSCIVQTQYMAQHIWIFVGLSMISGVLFFFKSLETLNYLSGRVKQ